VKADGSSSSGVQLDEVSEQLGTGTAFWLDIGHPSEGDLAEIGDLLEFHRLVREDIGNFGQRPKADDYPGHTLLVLFGATHDEDSLVEVHAIVSGQWLVTVHTESCPAFIGLRKRTTERGDPIPSTAMLTQHITDSLADSFYPELEQLDDRVDDLERLVLDDKEHGNVLPACSACAAAWSSCGACWGRSATSSRVWRPAPSSCRAPTTRCAWPSATPRTSSSASPS
jgi:Mg2+ and Co2+ transporter CorA